MWTFQQQRQYLQILLGGSLDCWESRWPCRNHQEGQVPTQLSKLLTEGPPQAPGPRPPSDSLHSSTKGSTVVVVGGAFSHTTPYHSVIPSSFLCKNRLFLTVRMFSIVLEKLGKSFTSQGTGSIRRRTTVERKKKRNEHYLGNSHRSMRWLLDLCPQCKEERAECWCSAHFSTPSQFHLVWDLSH